MPQDKHKYRVSLYLGKENYQKLEVIASALMIPVSTLCKIIFATGMELSSQFEKKGGVDNGNQ